MGWLDWVFPKKCVGCGRWGQYVCNMCEVGLWEEEQVCPGCGRVSRYGLKHSYCKQKSPLTGLTCFWAYEGIARKLITGAKYHFYYDFLGELISSSLSLSSRTEFAFLKKFLAGKPVVVPVPLHPRREKERGFNQAEIIAKLFAARYPLLLNSYILRRVRDTGKQVGKEREERMENIKNAFEVDLRFKNKDLRFKNVLLVDDVWTTGATMNECAKVLKRSGVEEVWGLVLAR